MSTVALAAAVFAATNVDDIVLLAAFFADERIPRAAIVIGQFAGIFALTAASAVAAYAALAVPGEWVALLGFIPLSMGVAQLWALWRRGVRNAEAGEETEPRPTPGRRLGSHSLRVMAVTIANGGDNLGVYIPVFATDVGSIPSFAVVFGVLTAVLCAAGYLLVNNPVGRALTRRGGRIVLPVALIAVGLYVLLDARILLR